MVSSAASRGIIIVAFSVFVSFLLPLPFKISSMTSQKFATFLNTKRYSSYLSFSLCQDISQFWRSTNLFSFIWQAGVAYLLAFENANNLTMSPTENIEYDR